MLSVVAPTVPERNPFCGYAVPLIIIVYIKSDSDNNTVAFRGFARIIENNIQIDIKIFFLALYYS